MKECVIEILRSEVMDMVGRATAYEEVKNDGVVRDAEGNGVAVAREGVATVEDDGELLGRFWDESVGTAIEGLRGLLSDRGGVEVDGDVLRLRVRMSVGAVSGVESIVAGRLKSYLARAIEAKWYAVVDKGIAQAKAEGAAVELEGARKLMEYKRRPAW